MKKRLAIPAGGMVIVAASSFTSPESFLGNAFDHSVGMVVKASQNYEVVPNDNPGIVYTFDSYPGCVDLFYHMSGADTLPVNDSLRWRMIFDTRYMCLQIR